MYRARSKFSAPDTSLQARLALRIAEETGKQPVLPPARQWFRLVVLVGQKKAVCLWLSPDQVGSPAELRNSFQKTKAVE
jgi:hypothetical protein